MWKKLYAKVRADIKGTVVGGGLTTVALYVIDAIGAESDTELKTLVVAGAAYVTGKLAAYWKAETGPIVRG